MLAMAIDPFDHPTLQLALCKTRYATCWYLATKMSIQSVHLFPSTELRRKCALIIHIICPNHRYAYTEFRVYAILNTRPKP